MPRTSEESQFVPNLAPRDDEIVLCKTTDSALTGTNLRLILRNMNIENVVLAGIFTATNACLPWCEAWPTRASMWS
jgi:nicotinamidase-related amidase